MSIVYRMKWLVEWIDGWMVCVVDERKIEVNEEYK